MPRQTLTPPHSAPSHNPAPHCHSAPCAHLAPDTHPAPDAPAQHPASLTVLTVRPASGLSGDMLLSGLAALLDLDAPALDALTDELRLPALHGVLRLEARQVNGIAGVGCHIDLPHEHSHRAWPTFWPCWTSAPCPPTPPPWPGRPSLFWLPPRAQCTAKVRSR